MPTPAPRKGLSSLPLHVHARPPQNRLYLSPGREIAGEVRVIEIGLPENAIAQQELNTTLITPELVAELLPYRKPDGHKGISADCSWSPAQPG